MGGDVRGNTKRWRPSLRQWPRVRAVALPAWKIVSQTIEGFSKDRGDLLAAALAYYTLLSIAPLIIIAVAISGMVLGQGTARREAARALSDAMGPDAASVVEGWVDQAAAGGQVASAVGLGLVLVAASRLGEQLKKALNQIWNVDVAGAAGIGPMIAGYVKKRLVAFLVVLASGPLLLFVFASRALLTGFHHYLFGESPWSGIAVQGLQVLLSLTIVALISTAIFRLVPDRRVSLKCAAYGGLLTSVLFNAGNVGVGLYLGRASVGATYGVAGSLVVLLIWLHFSASMFLLGAEFTQQLHQRLTRRGLEHEGERALAPAQPHDEAAAPASARAASSSRRAHDARNDASNGGRAPRQVE